MKCQIFLWLAAIFFLTMACSFASTDPTAIPTAQPAAVIEVTPTHSPYAAEESNAGVHRYWMSPNENGCEASDDLKVPVFRDKEHTFSPDFSSVDYGGRTYTQVGKHRYQSINEDEKPLVLVYSEHGFILFVYKPGTDPNVDESCLTFSFTLAD